MNRRRNASRLALAAASLAVLAACGPRIEKAHTANDTMAPTTTAAAATAAMDKAAHKPMMRNAPVSAPAALQPGPGSTGFSGTVPFTPAANGVRLVADLKGAPPGKHGLHLHANGQ